MVAAQLSSAPLKAGAGLAARPAPAKRGVSTMMRATRKVNSYDDTWSKGPIGIGLFLEDKEQPEINLVKKIEASGLLSLTERLGLLSKAEKAGLTLSKVEELKLLSKAEELGLLSTAEKLLTTEPGKITSLSLPFIVATVAALTLIPSDNAAEVALKAVVAVTAGTAGLTCFVAGFAVAWLQEVDA